MRCVRSMACASTAGFHQGSSRNTYSAAVRFSPSPPAFRLIRNSAHRGVVLERVDARLAVARRAVEVLVADAGLVEAAAHDREQAGELREDQRLVALLAQLVELVEQHVELGAGLADALRVEQAGMAGGLPQPQQRFEHVHLGFAEALATARAAAAYSR